MTIESDREQEAEASDDASTDASTTVAAKAESRPTILSYLVDLPNLCSLVGLACSLGAIYFSILSIYSAAMIAIIWAVAFDWADGLIARRIKGRVDKDRAFGAQLDVLIDIVSYGVTPAVLLLSVTHYEPVYFVFAFIMVSAAALRLSFFSTYGLEDKKYTGLALDNNSIVLVFVFLFELSMDRSAFSLLLVTTCISLAVLNVSQIKTPKLSGNPINVVILVVYTLAITGIYGTRLA